jgi:hypothetical protein
MVNINKFYNEYIITVKTKFNSKQIVNWLKKERLKYNKNHVI